VKAPDTKALVHYLSVSEQQTFTPLPLAQAPAITMPEPTQQSGPTNLLRPLLLLSYSAFYIIPTIYESVLSFDFKPFQSFDDFKDAWFARFWAFFGPLSRENAAPKVMPLLRNSASGVCMDIGPGSGEWLYLFAKANNKDITKIYGVEPNPGMHKALRANAVKAGLGDIYEVVGCGAEELATKGGIPKGSIDTIITVQCLCSIPTPEKIIKDLYPYLKPGGQWLVYEHVKTKYQSDIVGYWQSECSPRDVAWKWMIANVVCRGRQHDLANILQWLRYY